MINSKSLIFGALLASTPFSSKADCETGPIIVSGKETYPPISFVQNNKLVGVGFSTLVEIAKSQNLSVKNAKPTPWKRVINNGRLGKIDVVIGLRVTNKSKDDFVFLPTSLIDSAQNIFTLKGRSLQSKEHLVGLRGGILSGTTFTSEFEKYAKKNLSISEVRKPEQNLKKLKSGRIDYFIAPLLPTIYLIENSEINIDIAFTPQPLFTVQEKIAISKKSNCVDKIDAFEKELVELHKNNFIHDRFDEISSDWNVLDYMR